MVYYTNTRKMFKIFMSVARSQGDLGSKRTIAEIADWSYGSFETKTCAMRYSVLLIETEEGFSVSCPALPGCHSQGATREEALANIREAISLWLEVAEEDAQKEAVGESQRVTHELVTV